MGYNQLINGVYWGYNPLILTFDPNFLTHPSTTPLTTTSLCLTPWQPSFFNQKKCIQGGKFSQFGSKNLDEPQRKLVGGFNLLEKYQSKWESSPSRGENKRYLKPPLRKLLLSMINILVVSFRNPYFMVYENNPPHNWVGWNTLVYPKQPSGFFFSKKNFEISP